MHSVLHAFTHAVVWASVVASAFVALVVTLAVEYFAKPGLEARKDRILDKGREKRKAINGVRRSTLLSHRLQIYRKEPVGVALLKDRINRATADLEEHMIFAFGTLNVPGGLFIHPITRVFSDGNSGDWAREILSTFPQPKMNIS